MKKPSRVKSEEKVIAKKLTINDSKLMEAIDNRRYGWIVTKLLSKLQEGTLGKNGEYFLTLMGVVEYK